MPTENNANEQTDTDSLKTQLSDAMTKLYDLENDSPNMPAHEFKLRSDNLCRYIAVLMKQIKELEG